MDDVSKAAITSSSSTTTVDLVRTVEMGTLEGKAPISVVLAFETEPFWIFVLHSQLVSKVFVDNALSSFSELNSYLSLYPGRHKLYNTIVSRVGISRFCFSFSHSDLTANAIVLVSGSPSFFDHVKSLYPMHRLVFVLDTHYTKRKLSVSGLVLRRLTHIECGGPTNFKCVIGCHNCTHSPVTTTIRRSIQNYLNFSLRPKAIQHSSIGSYTPAHILNINHMAREVVYNTFFLAAGVGQRSLTSAELGLMFGLSEMVASTTSLSCYPFPPVQCLDSALSPFLQKANHNLLVPQLVIPDAPQPTHTYLKDLNLHLHLSWSHVNYTVDVSAKSDDVEPVFRHWNERITLVLPRASTLLEPLRRLILTRSFRRLYQEFLGYLSHKYGHWNALLRESHRLNQGGGAPVFLLIHRLLSNFDVIGWPAHMFYLPSLIHQTLDGIVGRH